MFKRICLLMLFALTVSFTGFSNNAPDPAENSTSIDIDVGDINADFELVYIIHIVNKQKTSTNFIECRTYKRSTTVGKDSDVAHSIIALTGTSNEPIETPLNKARDKLTDRA